MPLPAPLWDPDVYLMDLFGSKAARSGGVIRRQRRDIERIVGVDRFAAELRRRGFSSVENGGQIVVFCNREPIRRLT
ncbi:N-(5'-phosphoribosyl)anthranilate isomerase [Rhodobacteraceae bacterium CCMM004]|nr:N-(5'-phosphoribosyl)anthranilate isomerase [Rhodobacteraceae bacterium CCMM004]